MEPFDVEPKYALWPDGSLEVTVPFQGTYVIASWPRGVQIRVREGDRLNPTTLDPELALIARAHRTGDGPLRAFAATIPTRVLDCAAVAGTFVLTALRLLREHPAAHDLAHRSPRLFWMLAAGVGIGAVDESSLAALLPRRRHEILGVLCGTTAAKAAVRFVERTEPTKQLAMEIDYVRRAASLPALVDAFAQVRRIPWQCLIPAVVEPDYLGVPTFKRVLLNSATSVGPSRVDEVVRLVDDIRWLARVLDLSRSAERSIARVRTVRGLRRTRDRLGDGLAERVAAIGDRDDPLDPQSIPLPSPPVPGTTDIVPIRTIAGLFAEGREMEHCVSTFARWCAEGSVVFYRVLAPERATLCLRVFRGGALPLDLRGRRNRPPTPATWSHVDHWLAISSDEDR